jgi:hypothetical protein
LWRQAFKKQTGIGIIEDQQLIEKANRKISKTNMPENSNVSLTVLGELGMTRLRGRLVAVDP